MGALAFIFTSACVGVGIVGLFFLVLASFAYMDMAPHRLSRPERAFRTGSFIFWFLVFCVTLGAVILMSVGWGH